MPFLFAMSWSFMRLNSFRGSLLTWPWDLWILRFLIFSLFSVCPGWYHTVQTLRRPWNRLLRQRPFSPPTHRHHEGLFQEFPDTSSSVELQLLPKVAHKRRWFPWRLACLPTVFPYQSEAHRGFNARVCFPVVLSLPRSWRTRIWRGLSNSSSSAVVKGKNCPRSRRGYTGLF